MPRIGVKRHPALPLWAEAHEYYHTETSSWCIATKSAEACPQPLSSPSAEPRWSGEGLCLYLDVVVAAAEPDVAGFL